jgi:hypothetical protein
LLLLVVVIPCSFAFIKHQCLRSSLIFWDNADFWIPCIGGFVCGVLWVAFVLWLAPNHKFTAAAASLLPGACLAWVLIGEVRFTTAGYMSGFSFTTRTPVFVTWWAGILGLAAMWLRERRRPEAPARRVTRPRLVGLTTLAVSVALLCGLVLPSTFLLARWTAYHWALRAIAEDTDDRALQRIRLLARIPCFDMDWSPGAILAHIPFGFALDMSVFGCPTCRGIHTTLLQSAARHGREEVVRWMVSRRGSINCGNDHGWGLLTAGIASGKAAIVGFLIDQGADATATNNLGGLGSMHHAVMSRTPPAVMERLLRAGAQVNALSNAGLTPLDGANMWEPSVIPFLTAHGATNAAVRDKLVLLPEGERLYAFDGTDFRIQLPEGFPPWNRIRNAPGSRHRGWEVRNPRNSTLSFTLLGNQTSPAGTNGDFNGFAAVISREENDWGTCWCASVSVVFDRSGLSREELDKSGRGPRYDAVLGYRAFNRRDQRLLEATLQTFSRNHGTSAQETD